MRQARQFIASAFTACLLSSCAIVVTLPFNRFDTPETTGAGRVKLDASSSGVSDIELTQNFVASRPDTTNPVIRENHRLYGGAGVGLTQWLDIEIRSNLTFQAKVQFLGQPRSKPKNGVTGGLVVGYGSFSDGHSSGSGSSTATHSIYELKGSRYEAALLLGYRFSDWLLWYLGPNFLYTDFSGVYARTDLTPPEGSFGGWAHTQGGVSGIEIGSRHFQLKVEAAGTLVSAGQTTQTNYNIGVAVGVMIGSP